MKCKYCGSDLKDTAKFCDNCGSKTDYVENKEPVVQSQIIYNYPKNNNSGLKMIIVFLLIVIVGGVGFGVWYFNQDDKNLNETPKEEQPKKDDKKEEQPVENQIRIDKYTVTLPPSFSYYSFEDKTYIQNDDCLITFSKYNLTYREMVSNKETILEEFNTRDFVVKTYEAKNIDGLDCVLVTGSVNDIEYGYLFTDINNETPIFFTISSSVLGEFKSEWFNYAVQIAKSAR